MSRLLLPAGVRPPRDVDRGRRRDNVNGSYVEQRHVDLGRRGWKHEVGAHWTDADGVQRTDVLWLDVAHQADQLARAAGDQLARSMALFAGLSPLARLLGLTPAN